MVDNAWQFEVEGSHDFHLANKLERTKNDLKKWGGFQHCQGKN